MPKNGNFYCETSIVKIDFHTKSIFYAQ